MRKITKYAALLSLVVLLSFSIIGCGQQAQQQDSQEEKGQVSLGYVEWDTEIASTNVVKTVLSEKMGYDVEITPVDNAVMWASIADGTFDGIVAAWLPGTHGDLYEEVKDSIVDLGPNLEGAKIGLVVPEYVDINSIEELNDNADKFGGKIVGIEPGAGVVKATENAIEEYDLTNIKLQTSSSAAMAASLGDAVDNNEWIAVTGWSPHWKFVRWDLKYLEDPKEVFGGEETINTIARQGLEEDMPEVYEFLDNFNWSSADMEQTMLYIEEGMSPEEAAQKWVSENEDKVNSWLPASAQ